LESRGSDIGKKRGRGRKRGVCLTRQFENLSREKGTQELYSGIILQNLKGLVVGEGDNGEGAKKDRLLFVGGWKRKGGIVRGE